jgi:hypothetical protein
MSLGYSAPTGGYCDDCGGQLGQYVETTTGEFVCVNCYNARATRQMADVEENA